MKLAPRPSRRSGVVIWVKLLVDSIGRSRMTGVAAEMAFWLFLSLLPLAAVAGLVLARFAMKDVGATTSLLGSLPPGTRDLLRNELGKVSAWNGGAVAPIAALTFVWLASSGVQSVFDGLELVAQANARPYWKKRLLAIGSCAALSIGVALIALLGAGMHAVEKLAGKLPLVDMIPDAAGLVVRLLIGFALAVGLVAGIYAVGLPKDARRRMPLLPGAIAAVIAQALLGFGYGMYVRRMGDGGAYQAGLAVIGITLIALYLLSIALLVGIELNLILGARRLLEASVHPAISPPPPVTHDMVRADRPVEHLLEHDRDHAGLRPSLSGVS